VAQRVFGLKKIDEFLPAPVKTSEGLCLVQLKERDPATRAQFEKDKGILVRGLRQVRAQEALTGYVADLRKKAEKEIKVNPAFLPKANAKDAEPAG
jgi:parvulin-like peptidyl-prolyl isomerase